MINMTRKMCDKSVDSYLLALKFVPDWFVTSNVIDVFGNLDFDFLTFFIP